MECPHWTLVRQWLTQWLEEAIAQRSRLVPPNLRGLGSFCGVDSGAAVVRTVFGRYVAPAGLCTTSSTQGRMWAPRIRSESRAILYG